MLNPGQKQGHQAHRKWGLFSSKKNPESGPSRHKLKEFVSVPFDPLGIFLSWAFSGPLDHKPHRRFKKKQNLKRTLAPEPFK